MFNVPSFFGFRSGNYGNLLLDKYSGAAAAYSLRGLSTPYVNGGTPYACQVRNGSNIAANIGFVFNSLTGDYDLDTAALLAHCGGGDGFVDVWYDQSGNVNDTTQATALSQPQIVSSGSVILENGKPCISSTSGYKFLSRTWGIALSNPQLFYVGKITTVFSGYSGHWIDLGNRPVSNSNHFISAIGDEGTYQDIFQNTRPKYGTSNPNLNERYLEVYENIGTTTTRYLNNISNGSNTFTVTTPVDLLIGGSGTLFPANGTLQEVVIYSTGNSSNRTGISTNINDYYSIY